MLLGPYSTSGMFFKTEPAAEPSLIKWNLELDQACFLDLQPQNPTAKTPQIQ